jgi:hypothetical protein
MFVAVYTSTHFEFIALDLDREKALKTMEAGLEQHGVDKGIGVDWFRTLRDRNGVVETIEFEDEVNIYEVYPGQCLRDGMVIR